jgi:hypothetical protein
MFGTTIGPFADFSGTSAYTDEPAHAVMAVTKRVGKILDTESPGYFDLPSCLGARGFELKSKRLPCCLKKLAEDANGSTPNIHLLPASTSIKASQQRKNQCLHLFTPANQRALDTVKHRPQSSVIVLSAGAFYDWERFCESAPSLNRPGESTRVY